MEPIQPTMILQASLSQLIYTGLGVILFLWAIIFFFYKKLDKKIDKLDTKTDVLSKEISEIRGKTDILHNFILTYFFRSGTDKH